jgi:hypothetical protein
LLPTTFSAAGWLATAIGKTQTHPALNLSLGAARTDRLLGGFQRQRFCSGCPPGVMVNDFNGCIDLPDHLAR